MAQSKATKKFEKNQLKDTLKRRNDFAKIKQRHQLQAKKKARRAHANDGSGATGEADGSASAGGGESKEDALESMDVDEFFAGGYDIAKSMQKSDKSRKSPKRKHDELEQENNDEGGILSGEDVDEPNDTALGGDAMGMHKKDLQALAKKDPEFYKFLQEEDAELLDFEEDSNLVEIDDLSASDDEATSKGAKSKQKQRHENGSQDVTHVLVKRWSKGMQERHSLRAMREVVLAFRAAAHLNDESDKTYKYTISNADVYHELLVAALRDVPAVLRHHVPLKDLPNGKIRLSTETKKFRTLTPLLKSHALAVQHLLENLSDSATTSTALTHLLAIVPYLLSFKKLLRGVSRTISTVWSDGSQSETARINAFIVLRRLTTIGDSGIIQNTLKTCYQALLQGSRSTTVHSIAHINLMKNTSAELWRLPSTSANSVAYTTAFTFIRALAIHLRTSIKQNANESYKAVYNWQYIHSLDFWSRVLAAHCDSLREATAGKESPLRPLIYPLVQVTLGAMRLIPQAAYFPLRFHCMRALLRISSATNTFIPLAAGLYEVLTSAEMRRASKGSTLKPIDFSVSLRAHQGYLHTRVYQDGVGEQVTELFSEFFALWSKNIAFPELALPVIVMLKRWLKQVSPYNPNAGSNGVSKPKHKGKDRKKPEIGGNRNGKLNFSVSLLVQKLEANSSFIEERRAKVEYSPRDRAGVESFLKDFEFEKTPLGAFVVGQRKTRQERRKVLEGARQAEQESKEKARNKKRKQGVESDDEDDEGMLSGSDSGEEGEEELELEDDEGEMEDGVDVEEEDDLEDLMEA
ncbi:MAG: Nucleolar Complex 2 protein [Chrysothrix sp. TS-e1954]|nr:MAG: Nucleolar Complex 2 protein [Chrysothrix sp. TS-e1954]